METMLRTVLADRFGMVARAEAREQDAYVLVIARQDRLGAELRPASLDCAELVERRPGSSLNLPPRTNGAPPCGLSSDGQRLSSGGITIAQLIRNISPLVDRPILDRTGLDGYYEFTLEFAARSGNATGVPESTDSRASIFTAVREQLGLSLQPLRAPVEVLVIERIERPTPN